MKNDSGMKQSAGTKTGAVGLALGLGVVAVLLTGCRSDMAAVQQAPIVDGNSANDPANVNMAVAPVAGTQPAFDAATAARNGYAPGYRYTPQTRVAGQSFSAQPESYGQDYPVQNGRQTRSEAYNYNTQSNQGYQDPGYQGQNYQGQGYNQSVDGYGVDDDQLYSELLDTNVPIVQQPPPPLPQYEQPVAPGPDYLWTPGYWNYANTGYYYVPGNWVSAPFAGALWTPGWWGYTGRGYGWHRGYWGRHVGYYGGVNYGFGFIGIGYQGGYWNNDHFLYNRDCNHVDPRTVNNYVYQRDVTVTNNRYVNNTRISYNGGPGGLNRRPLPAEFAANRETHLAPLPAQVAERQAASQNRQQFFANNQGRPQQMFAAHPVLERNVNVPAQLAQPQRFSGGQANGLNHAQSNNPQQGIGGNDNTRFNQSGAPFRPDQQRAFAQQQLANNQRQEQQLRQQDQMQRQQQANVQERAVENQARAMQQNQQVQRGFQQQNRAQQDQQRAVQQQARQQQDQQRGFQQQIRAQQDQQRAVQQQARQQQDQQRMFQQQNRQQQVQQQARQQQDQQRAVQQQARPQQDQQRMAQQQLRPQPEQRPQQEQPRPAPQPAAQAHPEGHERGR